MKRTLALLIGLALVASALTVAAQSTPGRGQGKAGQTSSPSQVNKGGGTAKDGSCGAYCPGQGQGQQKRYGWGKGQGQGQGRGQGKGYRGGACDGSGPKRDGSCDQCPAKS